MDDKDNYSAGYIFGCALRSGQPANVRSDLCSPSSWAFLSGLHDGQKGSAPSSAYHHAQEVAQDEVRVWSVGENGEAEVFVCRKGDLARLTKEKWGEENDAFVAEARCLENSDILNFTVPLEELHELPAWALEPLAESPRLYQPQEHWAPDLVDPEDPEDPETLDVIVRVKASEILALSGTASSCFESVAPGTDSSERRAFLKGEVPWR